MRNIHVRKWKIEDDTITNMETGEVRPVSGLPSSSTIAYMDFDNCLWKCEMAFNTGAWPMTTKTCGFCGQERLVY